MAGNVDEWTFQAGVSSGYSKRHYSRGLDYRLKRGGSCEGGISASDRTSGDPTSFGYCSSRAYMIISND